MALDALDFDKVSVGTMEDLEDLFGLQFGEFIESVQSLAAKDGEGNDVVDYSRMTGKMFGALAFLVGRATDPAYTKDQARAMTMGGLTALIGDPAPTTA